MQIPSTRHQLFRASATWAIAVLMPAALLIPATSASAELPEDSIFVRLYRGGFGEHVGFDTGIRTTDYVCGVAGFAALNGDINENGAGTILQAYAYPSSGTWRLKADFRSHQDHHEQWDLRLLCAKRSIAALGGPGKSSVPLFLRSFTNLRDNTEFNTGYKTSDWVCGIVGMQALDGDLNEHGTGTIMKMFMYPRSGSWRVRPDFRTDGNNETWGRIDVLCARTSVAQVGQPLTSSSSDLFLTELWGLPGNGHHDTGVSSSDFVCAVVGMEIFDGDIEEDGTGNIIQAYAYASEGSWRVRTNFRTEAGESWNIKLLCIRAGPAQTMAQTPVTCNLLCPASAGQAN